MLHLFSTAVHPAHHRLSCHSRSGAATLGAAVHLNCLQTAWAPHPRTSCMIRGCTFAQVLDPHEHVQQKACPYSFLLSRAANQVVALISVVRPSGCMCSIVIDCAWNNLTVIMHQSGRCMQDLSADSMQLPNRRLISTVDQRGMNPCAFESGAQSMHQGGDHTCVALHNSSMQFQRERSPSAEVHCSATN